MENFMNKNRLILLLILISSISFSCKKSGSKSATLADKVLNNDLNFNYLSTKAKVDYLDSEQNLSTPMHIKIKQDSAIWMSITPALGIEMMRILIRKDSVFMMNRLKKEYYAGSFDFIRQELGFNVNYKLVEKLLIGDIPLKKVSTQKVTKTDSHYLLEQMLKEFVITNSVRKDNARLDKISIVSNITDMKTNILYSEFENIGEIPFAKKINLHQSEAGKTKKIDVKFSKTKLSEEAMKLPFSIPKNYEEIKVK